MRNKLSPMGSFRAGVFTVGAAKAFADLQLEGGCASGGGVTFGGAAGGVGAGGAGPALGSPQEATLVVQRKVGSRGKIPLFVFLLSIHRVSVVYHGSDGTRTEERRLCSASVASAGRKRAESRSNVRRYWQARVGIIGPSFAEDTQVSHKGYARLRIKRERAREGETEREYKEPCACLIHLPNAGQLATDDGVFAGGY